MERKLKKTATAISLAMVVAILTGLLILNGRPERFAYALNMSDLSWGTDVTDAKLNEKNGTQDQECTNREWVRKIAHS